MSLKRSVLFLNKETYDRIPTTMDDPPPEMVWYREQGSSRPAICAFNGNAMFFQSVEFSDDASMQMKTGAQGEGRAVAPFAPWGVPLDSVLDGGAAGTDR